MTLRRAGIYARRPGRSTAPFRQSVSCASRKADGGNVFPPYRCGRMMAGSGEALCLVGKTALPEANKGFQEQKKTDLSSKSPCKTGKMMIY